ncbi:MAG TPA: transposase [Sphingobacteriaceae bacterium]
MGFKYRIDGNSLYFLTTTVIGWIDVFTRKELAEIIISSIKHCQKEKGLVLYAWCLMPSHLHLIAAADEDTNLSDIMRDFKKFTSKKIVASIPEIYESRREWMMGMFEHAGRTSTKNKEFKFWQDGLHPIELTSNKFTDQKLDYVHNNPVEAGIVAEPHHYLYSSALNYSGGLGLIDVEFIQ